MIRSTRMIYSALLEAAWARDFGPNPNRESLHEFMELWPRITQVQQGETFSHILLTCVLARTIWMQTLQARGKADWTPTTDDSLVQWCSNRRIDRQHQKDTLTLLLLIIWEIWKHWNAMVFDNVSPAIPPKRGYGSRQGFWRDWDSFFAGMARWADHG